MHCMTADTRKLTLLMDTSFPVCPLCAFVTSETDLRRIIAFQSCKTLDLTGVSTRIYMRLARTMTGLTRVNGAQGKTSLAVRRFLKLLGFLFVAGGARLRACIGVCFASFFFWLGASLILSGHARCKQKS